MIELDLEQHRALRDATLLVEELFRAGFIADQCRRAAIDHLAYLFQKEGVAFSSRTERRVERYYAGRTDEEQP